MTVTSYGQAARTVTRVFRTASKSITRSSNALSNYSELWSKTALASTELTKVNFKNTEILSSRPLPTTPFQSRMWGPGQFFNRTVQKNCRTRRFISIAISLLTFGKVSVTS